MDMQQKSELPEGWVKTPLLEISSLIRGVSYKKGQETNEEREGYVPLIRANNIQNNISFDNLKFIPQNLVSPEKILQQGDVILALSSGSKKVVGKAAYLFEPWNGTFGAFCGVLRPIKTINTQYFGYFFKTKEYRDHIYKRASGVNINNLKTQYFREIDFPLPPLAEQHRIVAAIEALFARLDATEARLARVPEIMKQFRQSVLAAACEGRLTEDWRVVNSNVTDEIQRLSNIQDELRLSTKSRKQTSPNDYGKHYSLPNKWIWSHLGHIASIDTGSTPYRKNSIFWENGTIPWVTSGLLQNEYITKASEYVTEIALKQTRLKIFPKNTLLIALYGEGNTRGKSAELLIESTINQACASINFSNSAIEFKNYIKIFLKKNYEEIRKQSSGGVQPNLNLSKIKAMLIPLPPLPEQHEIVRRVDALLKFADQIEARVAATQEHTEQLRQSILEQAFSGRLVSKEFGH